MAHSYRIKIAARLRPPIDGEQVDNGVQVEHGDGGDTYISVPNPRDPSQIFKFPFTSCYDRVATQQDIFENDVLPLIDTVYSGVTVTVFAYGVTSSGKTHTMQGSSVDPGIIPRAVEALFERRSGLERYKAELAISYMEIYKDEVYDLLVARDNAPKLPVRENDAGQVFVARLSALPIESVSEFDKIYTRAMKSRSVASTNLNRASSRSHAILTITVTLTDPAEHTSLCGKLNLVDLAGSENNKHTGNDPSRMAESSAINRSLSVLGQVVHALNSNASRVPYRNSKLTRLLQDALGGNAVGLLICNLAPGTKFRQETLNTLNFAVRTKNVENKPVVNEKDTRPVPKPHFAALHTTAVPNKPLEQSSSTSSSSTHLPLVTVAPSGASGRSRPSLAPSAPPSQAPSRSNSAAGSRMPRPSLGPSGSSSHTRLSLHKQAEKQKAATTLTDAEIDARIARAVEAEVARRLEERLREEDERRAQEEEERRARDDEERRARDADIERRIREEFQSKTDKTLEQEKEHRSHEELEIELRHRLEELENKLDSRDNSIQEVQMVDVLSPVSRKRTGRAYVALARSHSEKGNLQLALELYRKAETYVPDNIKLKERIIEIEWAVKHGKPFNPSPKKPKKPKTKKIKEKSKGKGKGKERATGPSSSQVPEEVGDRTQSPSKQSPRKGKMHSTATGERPRSPKRHADEMLEGSTGADDSATPPRAKRGRISVQQDTQPEPGVGQDSDWEQWEPPQLERKEGKRRSLLG